MSEQNDPKPRARKPAISRPAGPSGARYSSRVKKAIDWGDISRDGIGEFVQNVTRNGPAIMLGRTSDGGALSITILDGDDKLREWPHTPEEFEEIADWARDFYSLG
jgi:hypothetical protein